jgi:hypothetical protein
MPTINSPAVQVVKYLSTLAHAGVPFFKFDDEKKVVRPRVSFRFLQRMYWNKKPKVMSTTVLPLMVLLKSTRGVESA